MAAPNIDLAALALGDVCTSGKGAKSVPFWYPKREVPVFQPPEPLAVLYEPSGFNDATAERVNLVMRPTPELLGQLEALDNQIVAMLALDSVKYFAKPMTEAEVRERYSPLVKTSDKGYLPTFKAKMNIAGRGKVRIWDENRLPRDAPESWQSCRVVPRLSLRSLWMMSKEVGPLLEVSDVMVIEGVECPL
jgi:hypothetical protein